ncbi:uncharacterized protein LOC132556760 [Ylistrum balloti]|uniref:uncharacterized protein LOC132556760 n=1 Tax=Ylistrum balloti TaxID=509963 RepID=UPI002905F198|nr:uncharacterized protein LOC132556760 [Ylistrum balloti]
MDSREENHSGWEEFQDPRGTPVLSERSRYQKEDDKQKDTNSLGRIEKIRQKTNGTLSIDDNITAHGDLLVWDLDNVDVEYTCDMSDHGTPRMATPPKDIKMYVNQGKQVSLMDPSEGKPHRPIFSPSDAIETYRFRDVFSKPEFHQTRLLNRLGKIDAGGAFVIDNNITMHGDVMMLDLDSEGHTSNILTAVEKLSQLTETPMTVTKSDNKRATTGIRHLMAIRNPELAELPKSSGNNPEMKRKKKTRQNKIKENVIDGQEPEKQRTGVINSLQEDVVIDTNLEKKPVGFLKMMKHQMSRFGAFIQKKLICH